MLMEAICYYLENFTRLIDDYVKIKNIDSNLFVFTTYVLFYFKTCI